MTRTEEWLRASLQGQGGVDGVPERLRPEQLRRRARRGRRRRAALGVGAVVVVTGLGVVQVDRLELLGGPQPPATTPSVVVTSPPSPTPAASQDRTPGPTATPAPFTFVVERFGLSKGQSADHYEVYARYRTSPGVLMTLTGPDGRASGTHEDSTGLGVRYTGPGEYLLTASRAGRSETRKVDVGLLEYYPQGDVVATTTKAAACGRGTAADRLFTVTLRNTNTTDATVTVRFTDVPPGQDPEAAPSRTYTFRSIDPTATLRMAWPCDLRGYGSETAGGSFRGEVVLVNEAGRETAFSFANEGTPGGS